MKDEKIKKKVKMHKGQPTAERRIVGKKERLVVKLPALLQKMKEKEEKSAKTYYAIYDEQLNKYIPVGYNTTSLREAIEDLWDYWEESSDSSEEDLKIMKKWNLKQKKGWLEGMEFKFEKRNKKFEEIDNIP